MMAELAVLERLLHLGEADLAVVVRISNLDVLPALVTDLVLGEEAIVVLVSLLESLGGLLRLLLRRHRGVIAAAFALALATLGECSRGNSEREADERDTETHAIHLVLDHCRHLLACLNRR